MSEPVQNNDEVKPAEPTPVVPTDQNAVTDEEEAMKRQHAEEEAAAQRDLDELRRLMPEIDFDNEAISTLKLEITTTEASISLTTEMIKSSTQMRDSLQKKFDAKQNVLKDLEDGFKKRQKEAVKTFGEELAPIFKELKEQVQSITADERATSTQAAKILTSVEKTCDLVNEELKKAGVGVDAAAKSTQDQALKPATPEQPASAATEAAATTDSATTTTVVEETEETLSAKLAELQAKLQSLSKEQRQINGERQILEQKIVETEKTIKTREQHLQKQEPYAIGKFVQEFLPSVDATEKNLSLISDQQRTDFPVMDKASTFLRCGLVKLRDTFNKHGITEVNPLKEAFDEKKHQSLGVTPAPNAEPGTVVAVSSKGYMLKDHPLRPAKVLVAQEPT